MFAVNTLRSKGGVFSALRSAESMLLPCSWGCLEGTGGEGSAMAAPWFQPAKWVQTSSFEEALENKRENNLEV